MTINFIYVRYWQRRGRIALHDTAEDDVELSYSGSKTAGKHASPADEKSPLITHTLDTQIHKQSKDDAL